MEIVRDLNLNRARLPNLQFEKLWRYPILELLTVKQLATVAERAVDTLKAFGLSDLRLLKFRCVEFSGEYADMSSENKK